MVNVLITTKPDDYHAIYVKLALQKKGHHATLWYTNDYPIRQAHTFTVSQGAVNWYAKGVKDEIDNSPFDIVWFRRPAKPVLPPWLHQDDRENAGKENEMYYQSFWHVIAPGAIWINPYQRVNKANSKLLQLKVAAQVGFKIPETLFSNDPDKIRGFLKQHENQEIVYKSLYPMSWLMNDGVRLTYTTPIAIDDLPPDHVLQATPGIFQKKIKKAYELRVTYFGGEYVAAKINSQKHPKAKMDWRSAPVYELEMEEVKLPDHILKCCHAFMQKLGLVFGCLDMIVTPDNEYYFLEVNEQGQFLWVEEVNPKIHMLDQFTNFIIRKGNQCGTNKLNIPITLQSIKNEVDQFVNKAQMNR